MNLSTVSQVAQEFGFTFHAPDSTGHYVFTAPGIRIQGRENHADSGCFSSAPNRNNPLYPHSVVIVNILRGADPNEKAKQESSPERADIYRKFVA